MNQENQDYYESRAQTVEEAVSEALLHLGAREDEVEIEVVEQGKSGLFGVIGRKLACVRVRRKARSRRRGRRGGRSRGRGEGDVVEQSAAPQREERGGRRRAAEKTEKPREDREPRRELEDREPRREREDREPRRPREDVQPAARAETPVPVAEAPRVVNEQLAVASAPAVAPVVPVAPVEPAVTAVPAGEAVKAASVVAPAPKRGLDEAAETQRWFAEEIMRRSGFVSRSTVTEDDYNRVRIIADSDSAAVLIGRRGFTVDALEHLVERMSAQALGEHVPMNLDINNYRNRQEGKLYSQATDAIDQVRRTGQEVHLPPMSPRERRLIHLEVAELEDLETYTVGEGYDRHVVVTVTGGSPEASAEAASEVAMEADGQDD